MSNFAWRLLSRLRPVRRIEVSFNGDKQWHKAFAVFGVYHAYWWAGPFPLLLTQDGQGIILRRDLTGYGKPYPQFVWRAR